MESHNNIINTERKYTLTIFLMNEYVKEYEWCIKEDKEVKMIELDNDLNIDGRIVISDTSQNKPAWEPFLNCFSCEEIKLESNASNKAVMLIKIDDRIMALTFGYGRSILNENYIERDFGLRVAINLIDTNKMRSINAANIEDTVVNIQKQSSHVVSQEEFSINGIYDVVTAVMGKSVNIEYADRISGKDSLVVTLDMKPTQLIDKLKIFLDAYKSDAYKKNFPWIDNMKEIRDKEKINALSNEIVSKIKRKDIYDVYISPPETINWSEVKGLMLTGMNKRRSNIENYSDEPSFYDYAIKFEDESSNQILSKLKSDRLLALYNDDNSNTICSVYAALVAQVKYEDDLYVLYNGVWYLIKNDFYNNVKDAVSKIAISDIDFPVCHKDEHEGDYNDRVSKQLNFCLFDKRLVKVEGGLKQIEACDLFTDKKQFIHVKHKYSSAHLSHLFAQGKISAQCFVDDEQYRKQVYDITKEKYVNDVFDYKKKPQSQEFEIVYAIITDKIGKIEESIPFFSLVNLMLAAQELERMHIKCSVKLIEREV